MALYQLYQRDWEISVKQSNRGIDVFKLTLEEFKQSKTGHSQNPSKDWYAPLHSPNVTQSSFAYASNQNVAPPVVFSAFSRNDAGYGGYSAGVSPSESPTDPTCYEAYNLQDEGIVVEEPPYHFPIPTPNLTFIPFPGPPIPPPHPHPMMPHHPIHHPPVSGPAVQINYCQYGLVVPPPAPPQAMQFPPPQRIMLLCL